MLQLFQFYPLYQIPNASPFCLKVETFLKIAELPYQNKYIFDPSKSPTSKLPFVRDEGETIADSRFILEHLTKKHLLKLDQHLSEQQKAQGTCLTRLLEDSLYWSLVYSRWIDDRFWPQVSKDYFSKLKFPLRLFLPNLIRRQQRQVLQKQGLLKLASDQIFHLAKNDIEAVANLLGKQDYILGEKVTSFDAVTYGFLANLIYPDLDTPLKQHACRNENLIQYCDRIKARFW